MTSVIKHGKDLSDKCQATNFVYKFNCKDWPATYIGQTESSLHVRITDHKINNQDESAVYSHQEKFSHEFDWDNTIILGKEKDYKRRSIS